MDDIIVRDSEGQLAVNTVSSTEANVPYNYDDCFTVDENGRRALRVVGAGGGSVDLTKVLNVDSLPTASAENAGKYYLYSGATDSNYTHGYIYENKSTTTYTSTVSFDPASISSTTATCSGDDFAALVAEWGSGDITTIIKGTLTYDVSGGLLVFVGKDDTDTTVCTFQLYTQDYEDAGFVFTGTFADGDVIAFTCTIEEDTVSYAWERIDVQPAPVIPDPLPSQTGNMGKLLTTNGTNASWSDTLKELYVKSNNSNYYSIKIKSSGAVDSGLYYIENGNDIGYFVYNSNNHTWILKGPYSNYFVFDELNACLKTNSTGGTLGNSSIKWNSIYVTKINNGADIDVPNVAGTMVVATPPTTDGTYVLKATVADGVVTYTWVAE